MDLMLMVAAPVGDGVKVLGLRRILEWDGLLMELAGREQEGEVCGSAATEEDKRVTGILAGSSCEEIGEGTDKRTQYVVVLAGRHAARCGGGPGETRAQCTSRRSAATASNPSPSQTGSPARGENGEFGELTGTIWCGGIRRARRQERQGGRRGHRVREKLRRPRRREESSPARGKS